MSSSVTSSTMSPLYMLPTPVSSHVMLRSGYIDTILFSFLTPMVLRTLLTKLGGAPMEAANTYWLMPLLATYLARRWRIGYSTTSAAVVASSVSSKDCMSSALPDGSVASAWLAFCCSSLSVGLFSINILLIV